TPLRTSSPPGSPIRSRQRISRARSCGCATHCARASMQSATTSSGVAPIPIMRSIATASRKSTRAAASSSTERTLRRPRPTPRCPRSTSPGSFGDAAPLRRAGAGVFASMCTAMRYLIPAAGMGRRMGDAAAGAPKCLIEVNGETLIARLLRQIRASDPRADIHVIVGFRSDAVVPLIAGCRIIVNPFFDRTGINGSIWLARESFEQPVTLIHADLLLGDDLARELFTAAPETLMAYDSSLRNDAEVNVAVDDG